MEKGLNWREAMKFRAFIIALLFLSLFAFPISIALFPVLIAAYLIFIAECGEYDDEFKVFAFFVPIVLAMTFPFAVLNVSQSIFLRPGVFTSLLRSISTLSIFNTQVETTLGEFSPEGQEMYSVVIIFGLFLIPALYAMFPTLALIFCSRDSKSPDSRTKPTPSKDCSQPMLLKRADVVSSVMWMLVAGGPLAIHAGLIGQPSPDFKNDFLSDWFVAELIKDYKLYPAYYLFVHGMVFNFANGFVVYSLLSRK